LSLRTYLIRGAFGSLIIKLSQTALTLILVVVLARLLGVKGFGIYAFCISVVNLLMIPSMLGGQNLLVREIAAYRAKEEYSLLRGLVRRIRQMTTAASFFIALCAACIGMLIYQDSQMQIPFITAMAMVPLMAALELHGAALRGFRYILTGQVFLALLPAFVIILFYLMIWVHGAAPSPETAIIAHAAAAGLLVAAVYVCFSRLQPNGVKTARPAYETSRWISSMLPFVFAGGMQVLNREISVIFLGIMQGPEEVGLFRVAQRGAGLVPFGLMAVNMAIAPTVSELFAKGDKQKLQEIITKSTRAILGFAAPVAFFLILGGKWLIPFVFGQEYAPAYILLVILCLGQLFNAAMGSVGLILNMGGFEKVVARSVTVVALANILLNMILIPIYQTAGAAIATCGSMVLWNLLLGIWVYQKTEIISFISVKK
jgi:O-antigen/teichoic acid export membrane protein